MRTRCDKVQVVRERVEGGRERHGFLLPRSALEQYLSYAEPSFRHPQRQGTIKTRPNDSRSGVIPAPLGLGGERLFDSRDGVQSLG